MKRFAMLSLAALVVAACSDSGPLTGPAAPELESANSVVGTLEACDPVGMIMQIHGMVGSLADSGALSSYRAGRLKVLLTKARRQVLDGRPLAAKTTLKGFLVRARDYVDEGDLSYEDYRALADATHQAIACLDPTG